MPRQASADKKCSLYVANVCDALVCDCMLQMFVMLQMLHVISVNFKAVATRWRLTVASHSSWLCCSKPQRFQNMLGFLTMLSTMPWQATALDSAVASHSDFKVWRTVLFRFRYTNAIIINQCQSMSVSQSLSISGSDVCENHVRQLTVRNIEERAALASVEHIFDGTKQRHQWLLTCNLMIIYVCMYCLIIPRGVYI